MYQLKNEFITLQIEKDSKVSFFSNNSINPSFNFIQKEAQSFWRLIFKKGENWENVVDPEIQSYRVETSSNAMTFFVDSIKFEGECIDLSIAFEFVLNKDEILCKSSIKNNADIEVTELLFPRIAGVGEIEAGIEKQDLIWPHCTGQKIQNLKERKELFEALYPFPASMQWFELTNSKNGIYFGSHDDSFGVTALRADSSKNDSKGFVFEFVKYPFINENETWVSCTYVVSAHCGSWHVGADKYKIWSTTWRKPSDKPNWVKNMKGMLLVILKQQYGDIMWKYNELPELLEFANENGMDTIGMFGWTEGGHDNKYPVFEPNPAMGSEEELKIGLKEVEALGGNTIMYCQGLLLDVSHPFYQKEGGYDIAAKNMWNVPYYQEYNKFYHSNMLKNFNTKGFALACPSDPNWIDMMSKEALKYIQYGTNGILYDQIGGHGAYLCFDKNHPHDKPNLGFTQGRIGFLQQVRMAIKENNDKFAFTTELITDVFSQHMDVLHGWMGCAPSDFMGLKYDDNFPSIFRYTFPDTIITIRNPRPFIAFDIANFAFTYGFRLESEIRYKEDVIAVKNRKSPELIKYAKKISELRDSYWNLLGEGEFISNKGAICSNKSLIFNGFEDGEERAYIIWNNSEDAQELAFEVAGYEFVEAATVETKLTGIPKTIMSQSVVVAVFRKA